MGAQKKQSSDNSQALSQPPHALRYGDVLRELAVDPDEGLTLEEAKRRLQQYGPNELEGGEGVSMVKIVIRQIANAMILVSLSIVPQIMTDN
jgi:Na+-exporting ATPase